MTLDDLADKSGVSKRTISAYEANETDPRLSTLQKIAMALDVNYHELVKGDSKNIVQEGVINQYKTKNHGKIEINEND